MAIAVTDDGNGNPNNVKTSQQQFNLIVRNTNTAPVLTPIPLQTIDSGKTLTVQLKATDSDGDQITYSGNNLPSGAVLDPQLGILTWTPTASQEKTYAGIQLTATDGNQSSTQTFSIQVNHVNHPPVLAPLPIQTGKENSPITFTLKADDIDGNSLIYSAITQLPTGATLDVHTGVVTWTPNYEQAGNYDFGFTATDTSGATSTRDVIVQIANVDRPPSIYISNHAIALGKTLNFKVVGNDLDSNTTLTYTADNLPSNATLDSATGQFIWTPTPGQLGDYHINFTVRDGELTASSQASIVVAQAPRTPTVNLDLTPSFPATPGQQVIVQTQAMAIADITNLTATVDGKPVTVDSQGRLYFTATTPGKVVVTATATDADGRVGNSSTVIKVRDPLDNTAPVVQFAYSFDGDKLTSVTKIVGTVNDSNLDS